MQRNEMVELAIQARDAYVETGDPEPRVIKALCRMVAWALALPA